MLFRPCSAISLLCSVSPKGRDFLSASRTHHEPLVVKLPPEMFEDEEDSSIVDDHAPNETPAAPFEIALSNVLLLTPELSEKNSSFSFEVSNMYLFCIRKKSRYTKCCLNLGRDLPMTTPLPRRFFCLRFIRAMHHMLVVIFISYTFLYCLGMPYAAIKC